MSDVCKIETQTKASGLSEHTTYLRNLNQMKDNQCLLIQVIWTERTKWTVYDDNDLLQILFINWNSDDILNIFLKCSIMTEAIIELIISQHCPILDKKFDHLGTSCNQKNVAEFSLL